MQRQTVYFSGRVQGVGFRYTVQNLALQYDVRGFVRNAPDGRVQLVMEGPEPQMKELVDSVKRKMDGFIDRVTVETSPATGEFDRFSIKH